MAVPTRPAAGAPIDATWGQVIHDTVGAVDVQSGVASVTLSAANSGSVAVTFPRPFASPPVVVANQAAGSTTLIGAAQNITATGFTALLYRKDEATTSLTAAVPWIAVGPRA